ncbi:MAG: hypothetical protein A3E36_02830 [Candidatus Andersenbacteria bacterium RIFCSPHIGHO2_12_FULL_45_11b]|uniref:Uncharacterized protein n=1 Tax=Candidatus Andersenbacteria bacterium RIFCSPHIGHO2_12_FULL_45_11b TaxID=1797282 RepID=A0A1G1XBA7_9BACT|nr:MAG: hypothetical protein A3E36_02830 [Candidatus Andersenbacteria bacterium RIFCSPHIGHO2_12_FULL_45_11b]
MAEENSKTIEQEGFIRVERDDRLLDVFPKETIEKGVQLWEKWTDTKVEIIRIHLPKGAKGVTRHVFSRKEIEYALLNLKKIEL